MAPLLLLLLLSLLSFHHQFQVLQAQDHDFSYMKSVHNASEMGSVEEEYDYIVIGGGTAGCPLAATLSENYSVLVLERGNAPQSHPSVLTTAGFFSDLLSSKDDGTTPFQRFTSEDGVGNARGRVLGGSSMVNGGFYSRGDDEFFAKSGVEWDMGMVEKAYEWVEESVVSRPGLDVWQSASREALVEAGVAPDNGFGLDHKIGTKTSGSTFDRFGRRHGAVELLSRGNLERLRVVVQATVHRIIFSTKTSSSTKAPSAIGVIYTDSKGKSHKAFVGHKGEIILSAGAIGSPQLLLLSGIGPQNSHPNVGKFMADNPSNTISLILPNSSMESSTIKVVGITNDYFIEPTLFHIQLNASTNLSLGIIAEKIPGPLSSGSLWLSSSTDAKAAPHVRFNYFANPIDLSRCVMAMKKIGDMLKTDAMDQFKHKSSDDDEGEFLFSGSSLPSNNNNQSEWESFCRTTVTTIWHYHGGCNVGKVVDGDFRVMGITSLRVVDGSTFNLSPGTNPQATLMMLGRYVGLKMLEERRG
ncbi:(R)-mandelonitrile lyase 4-like [Humulus lupulus]|uniref:(R)-mandelonitrile lyase 4-like n=1 Tax=Humulus lupulus TaxID=3486 RepID=UPI002B416111|nr:(R)-mandelonitrile lyase 4-like [Humulus lupulus]